MLTNLGWYPGHMTKARRAMEESLKLVDVIIELRDARIPLSSANPDLSKLGQGKKRLVLLGKKDLADPLKTQNWLEYLSRQDLMPLALDAREKKGCSEILKQLSQVAAEKKERDLKRGIRNRPTRIMIAGIPNVGKSTLTNSLAGRASTKTGDKPGVTRGLQWIRLSPSLELLDTPGLLWPKFDDETVGIHLALMGAIREEILPVEELALKGMDLLQDLYPGALREKYGLVSADAACRLEELALKQGLLQKGAQADISRAAARVLDDFRKGRLARISLEVPPV